MPIDSRTENVTWIKATYRVVPDLNMNLTGQALSICKGRQQHQRK